MLPSSFCLAAHDRGQFYAARAQRTTASVRPALSSRPRLFDAAVAAMLAYEAAMVAGPGAFILL
jgi:hypothetical protein